MTKPDPLKMICTCCGARPDEACKTVEDDRRQLSGQPTTGRLTSNPHIHRFQAADLDAYMAAMQLKHAEDEENDDDEA